MTQDKTFRIISSAALGAWVVMLVGSLIITLLQ